MGLGSDLKNIGKGGDLWKPSTDFLKETEKSVRKGTAFKGAHKGAIFGAITGGEPLLTAGANAYFTGQDNPGQQRALERAAAAGLLSNAGAFVHLLKRDEEHKPPTPAELPAQGAGITAAKQRARQRAIEQARGRFGLSATIATSPLGLQGQGADLGNKRLLGA